MEIDRTEPVPRAARPDHAASSLQKQVLRQRMFPEVTNVTRIGRYLILRFVGAGGMGQVFAAYDPTLDRKIAVKLLPNETSGQLERRTRLLREAQGLAKLSHPNVVQVYEAGEHDGQVYLAMEYVEGRTLAQWLAGIGDDGEPGPRPRAREILAMFVQAGRGLAAAHRAGLVHRDFKPSNVIIDRGGLARVLDFGLVIGAPSSTAGSSATSLELVPIEPDASVRALDVELTTTGTMLGTPAYMAPEQHTGELVDARTDQFGFCVALYEALTGSRPFAGETVAELRRNITEGVRSGRLPRSIPRHVARALDRGLALAPAERWPSLDALLEALQPRSRRRAWAITAALTLPTAGVGAWGVIDQYERELEDHADQIFTEQVARQQLERAGARQHDRLLLSTAARTHENPQLAIELLREVDIEREPDPSEWLMTSGERIDRVMVPAHVLSLPGEVSEARYSADGRWLAARAGKRIEVWDLAGPTPEPVELDLDADVQRFVFNPAQPDQLALASRGSIRVVSLLDGRQVRSIDARGQRVGHVRFSPDGRWLAAASMQLRNTELRLWPLADGEPIEVPLGEAVFGFDPDGSQLAIAGEDGTVTLARLDGSQLTTVSETVANGQRPGEELAVGVAFSPDRSRLAISYATMSADRATVRIWELDGGELGEPIILDGHTDRIISLEFSADGRRLVTGSSDRTARVWELDSGSSRVLHGHDQAVTAAFGPDGSTIVTASAETIRLWPIDGSAAPLALRGRSPQFAPDGSQLAVLDGHDVLVHALDRQAPRPALGRRLDLGPYYNSEFGAQAVTDPQGRWLASIVSHGHVHIWDTRDWQLATVRRLSTEAATTTAALAITSDATLAVGDQQGKVLLWRPDQRAPLELGTLDGPVTRCTFSPDGAQLLTTDSRGGATLWDPSQPGRSQQLAAHAGAIQVAVFSDDGRALASAAEADIQLWRELDGQPLALAGHVGDITTLDFDARGELLLSASDDGTARLWSAADGQLIRTFEGHDGTVEAARFSPDARSIVTASSDGIARVWPVAGGEPLLLRHEHAVVDAVFAPSGTELLTGTSDSTAHRWELGADQAPIAVELPGNSSPALFGQLPSIRRRSAAELSRVAYVDDGANALVITADSVWIWDADYSTDALLTWMWRSFPSCPSSEWRERGLGLDERAAEAGHARCQAMVECTSTRGYPDCKHLLADEPS